MTVRVIVVGAGGFLGSRICEALTRDGHAVVPVDRNVTRTESVFIELTHSDDVDRLADLARDQVVLYCANVGGRDRATKDPETAAEVNSRVPARLAEVARRLVYFSTDYVFSGDGSPASIDSSPNPETTYGITKLAGERGALSAGSSTTVIRTSGLYDPDGTRNGRFADLDTIAAADNSISTPTAVADLVDCVLQLLDDGPPIVHCVGPQPLTPYEFHILAALHWGFNVRPTLTDTPRTRVLAPTSGCTSSVVVSLRRSAGSQSPAGRRCVVFDTVGVVLGARRWRHSDPQFWLDQESLAERRSESLNAADVAITEQAYTLNPALPTLWNRFPSSWCRVIANNGPLATFERWTDRFDFPSLFDTSINSERDGVAKPDPAFFDLVSARSRSAAGGVLLDDRQDVIDGARRARWTAHPTRVDGSELVDRFDIDPAVSLECET